MNDFIVALDLTSEVGNSSISNSTASCSPSQSLPTPSSLPSGIHVGTVSIEIVTFNSSSPSTSGASSIRIGTRASSALVGLWSFGLALELIAMRFMTYSYES